MTTTVLKDLSELAQVRDAFPVDDRVPDALALVPVIDRSDADAIAALAASADQVLGEFRALVAADQERRTAARATVARWQELHDRAEHAAQVAVQMREAAANAEAHARTAVSNDDRVAAEALSAQFGRLATQAEAHVAALQREARAVVVADGGGLVEHQMRGMLELAGSHLDSGRYEEARRLLCSVEQTLSSVPDLKELFRTLQNRAEAVKASVAQGTLEKARRLHRREPRAALALLEPVDIDGLPDDLARHLYGLWLTVCRRFDLWAAVHYRVRDGHGAVLIPTIDGEYQVVSAIGLPDWPREHRVSPLALRGARALR